MLRPATHSATRPIPTPGTPSNTPKAVATSTSAASTSAASTSATSTPIDGLSTPVPAAYASARLAPEPSLRDDGLAALAGQLRSESATERQAALRTLKKAPPASIRDSALLLAVLSAHDDRKTTSLAQAALSRFTPIYDSTLREGLGQLLQRPDSASGQRAWQYVRDAEQHLGLYCDVGDRPAESAKAGLRERLSSVPGGFEAEKLSAQSRLPDEGGARPFVFESQSAVDQARGALQVAHQQNKDRLAAVLDRVVTDTKAELAEERAAGKSVSADAFADRVQKRLGQALVFSKLIDFEPYIPNLDKFQFDTLWEHPSSDPAEYLRLDVFAFKPGQLTTPHEHARLCGTWVARGDALELYYERDPRGQADNEVRLTQATRRHQWAMGISSNKPDSWNYNHAIGAGPDQHGIVNTVHLYRARTNEAAVDDLYDPLDLHGQNARAGLPTPTT
jgi:hypothetical protein